MQSVASGQAPDLNSGRLHVAASAPGSQRPPGRGESVILLRTAYWMPHVPKSIKAIQAIDDCRLVCDLNSAVSWFDRLAATSRAALAIISRSDEFVRWSIRHNRAMTDGHREAG